MSKETILASIVRELERQWGPKYTGPERRLVPRDDLIDTDALAAAIERDLAPSVTWEMRGVMDGGRETSVEIKFFETDSNGMCGFKLVKTTKGADPSPAEGEAIDAYHCINTLIYILAQYLRSQVHFWRVDDSRAGRPDLHRALEREDITPSRPLKFTSERPTEDGFYWRRTRDSWRDGRDVSTALVLVHNGLVFMDGVSNGSVEMTAEWAGPLKPPEG